MNKKVKLMKYLAMLITIIQIVMVIIWLFKGYLIFANAFNFTAIPNIDLRVFMNKYYQVGDDSLFIYIFGSLILPLFNLFILQYIKTILKDMSNGIRFKKIHITRVRLIAWVFIIKGILMGASQYISYKSYLLSLLVVIQYGVFIGLIILALAPIFAHGVEVQTDSDMIV